VRIEGDEISVPLGAAPSTHILKPATERFDGVVSNEALCMKLAGAVGQNVATVEARNVHGVEYLSVERYDRTHRPIAGGRVELDRLHQEDFCQAQGIVPEMKYQKEGGPSLKQCFALLREVSSVPALDLQRLLNAVIFNLLVGNNDAHGKNFSLLYHGVGTIDQTIRFAPLYDIVSTTYYPELSKTMAMKIGDEYSSENVGPRNFEQFAEEAGLAKPMVRNRVAEFAETVIESLKAANMGNPVSTAVAALIRKRSERIGKNFKN
jgi:serine/threonine-protein kinase HipA